MKIISIFAPHLYTIQYENETEHEWQRLLHLWNDMTYLFEFVEVNNIENKMEFINEIVEDIHQLDVFLNEINHNKDHLSSYFENLSTYEPRILALQKGKRRKSKLRLYAIKIDENVYLITGGAIKITQKMQDHPDTANELKKLNQVKDYLKQNHIMYDDAFYDFLINP